MASSPSRRPKKAKPKAKVKNKNKNKSASTEAMETSKSNRSNSNSGSDKSRSARKSALYYSKNGAMLREKAKLRMRDYRAARATATQLDTPAPAAHRHSTQAPQPDTPAPDVQRHSTQVPQTVTQRESTFSRSQSSPLPDDLTPEPSPSPGPFASQLPRSPRSPTPDLPAPSRSPSPIHRSRRVDDQCIDPRLRSTHMELEDIALQGVDLDLVFDLETLPYEFDIDNSDINIHFDRVNLPHNLDVMDHFDPEDEFYMVTHRRCVGEWASRWGHTSCWAQEIKSSYHQLRTELQREQFACTVGTHAYQGRIIVRQLTGILDVRPFPKEDWHLRELWRTSMELLEPMYRGLAIIDAWLDFLRVVSV